eukprot:55695_1
MLRFIWCLFVITSASTPNAPSSSFVYKISTPRKLNQFINAKNGYRVKSQVTELQGLDFQLHFYPEGRFAHQTNHFIVYLCINNLSKENKISSVFVDWNLFIHEINFSWIVKDRHHADTAKCRGFIIENNAHILDPLRAQLDHKKQPMQAITFSITIHIKHIFDGQQITDSQIPIQIKKNNVFKWHVDDKHMLDEILLSQHQQSYVSRLYNDMFFLSVTPNGYHEGTPNSLDMFLHVVTLPIEISKLKMKCIFKIPELKIVHDFEAEWTNADKGWGWPQRKYTLKQLKAYDASSKMKKLTILSECQTLGVFDQDGKPMTMKKHWKDFKLSAKNKLDVPSMESNMPKILDDNSDYCVASSNVSHGVHMEHISQMLLDMSQDIDILRQQLFVTIGMFTMNFGATVFMFTVLISLFCCGCL